MDIKKGTNKPINLHEKHVVNAASRYKGAIEKEWYDENIGGSKRDSWREDASQVIFGLKRSFWRNFYLVVILVSVIAAASAAIIYRQGERLVQPVGEIMDLAGFSADDLQAKGVELFNKADYQQSDRYFAEILSRVDSDYRALKYHGLCLYNLGNLSEARQVFDVMKLDYPNDAFAWNESGNIARDQGDKISAETGYRQAIAKDLHFIDSYINLALLFARAGRSDEARDVVDEGLSANPGDHDLQIAAESWN